MIIVNLPYWDLLVKSKLLDKKAMKKIESFVRQGAEDIEKIIVDQDLVPIESLLKVKAEHYGVNYVNLRTIKLKPEMLRLIPESMCRRFELISFDRGVDELRVVMNDPSDAFASEYIKMRTGYDLKPS